MTDGTPLARLARTLALATLLLHTHGVAAFGRAPTSMTVRESCEGRGAVANFYVSSQHPEAVQSEECACVTAVGRECGLRVRMDRSHAAGNTMEQALLKMLAAGGETLGAELQMGIMARRAPGT